MMNIYRTDFFADCPVNGIRIRYSLEIRVHSVIKVEAILEFVSRLKSGYHEEFADALAKRFGGIQLLRADHHGVSIETIRNLDSGRHHFLDQTVGGMAGTPGY